MIRSTTDEMLAARFDPEPWVDSDGTRHAIALWLSAFDPRPEYIPSRDPFAWEVVRKDGSAYRVTAPLGSYMRHWNTAEVRFAPRPEYVRPEPNPILVDVRHLLDAGNRLLDLIVGWDWTKAAQAWPDATPAQIEDARKVLTRLVNVYKGA